MSNQQVFGIHAVTTLITHHPARVIRLLVQQERQDKLMGLLTQAKQHGIACEVASRQTLDRLTQEGNHQGILAVCKPLQVRGEQDLIAFLNEVKEPLLLILDGVQDPHNLGACFRTADAAGVHAIVAPKDKSASITPVVSKVASGAAETVPFIQVTNLVRTMEALKELGIWIFGAAAEAEKTIYQTDLKGSAAFVLGAEGKGLRRLTRDHCDVLVSIPMRGAVTSLNVSVATGVMLFEAVRQRLSK